MDAIVARANTIRTSMSDQELCVVLWACGKLAYVPHNNSLDTIGSEFARRLPALPPLTISNMTKAFSKLKHFPTDLPISDILTHASGKLSEFSMAELSNLVWAVCQAQHVDESFFALVEEAMCERIQEASLHHVTSIVISLRKIGWQPAHLVSAARSHGFQV
jgi:hypothetical protein